VKNAHRTGLTALVGERERAHRRNQWTVKKRLAGSR
jgi:hypothetical protein